MARMKGTWGGRLEGAGPRAVLKDPVQIWMRLELKDARAAAKVATKRGLSLSALMRRLLRSYLKGQKRR